MICCSFAAAFFSRSARLLAWSAKDCRQHNKLVSSTSTNNLPESTS
jgi:hypothetical protein